MKAYTKRLHRIRSYDKWIGRYRKAIQTEEDIALTKNEINDQTSTLFASLVHDYFSAPLRSNFSLRSLRNLDCSATCIL